MNAHAPDDDRDDDPSSERRVCCEPGCGQTFVITAAEMQWLSDRGYKLPRRCPACRALRRQQRERESARW